MPLTGELRLAVEGQIQAAGATELARQRQREQARHELIYPRRVLHDQPPVAQRQIQEATAQKATAQEAATLRHRRAQSYLLQLVQRPGQAQRAVPSRRHVQMQHSSRYRREGLQQRSSLWQGRQPLAQLVEQRWIILARVAQQRIGALEALYQPRLLRDQSG